jgi:hypothetical protein
MGAGVKGGHVYGKWRRLGQISSTTVATSR